MGPANPQALNRYAYCLNNPLRYTDPSGHWNFELELTAEQAQAIINFDKRLDTIEAQKVVAGAMAFGILQAALKYAKVFPTHEQNIAQIEAAIETVRAVNPSVAGFMAWLVSPEAALFGGILATVGGADLAWTRYDISRLADALGEINAGTNGASLSLKGCGIYRITATNQNGSASFTTAVIGPWGSLVVPIIGTTAIYQ